MSYCSVVAGPQACIAVGSGVIQAVDSGIQNIAQKWDTVGAALME